MVLASDYPFLDILGTLLIFFAWVIWFWLLITVFADLFRRHDIGGWGKAGWIVLCVILPYVGVLIYLIAEGKGMAERRTRDIQASQAEVNRYIRETAGTSGPTDQIAKAKDLLDRGAITQAEFDQIKQKALAS